MGRLAADERRARVAGMLPGLVDDLKRLVDGFTAGFQPPPGQEAEHERRRRAVVRVGGEDADSCHGLGGYHGSARVTPCGTAYDAVAVYPESGNGVPVFDQP